MGGGRARTDEQGRGDLGVGAASHEQPQHLVLPRRQTQSVVRTRRGDIATRLHGSRHRPRLGDRLVRRQPTARLPRRLIDGLCQRRPRGGDGPLVLAMVR